MISRSMKYQYENIKVVLNLVSYAILKDLKQTANIDITKPAKASDLATIKKMELVNYLI